MKYLSRLGHNVTVVTSTISGEGPVDGASAVVRAHDLLASPLNWRRRHFAALTGEASRGYSQPSRLQSTVVPDLSLLSWMPAATADALRLARGHRFDVVVTSSPPPSAHLVGKILRSSGLAWVAELRDGWTFEPPRPPWPLLLQRRLDEALERSVLRRADAVVGVTRPIVEDVQQRLGVKAVLITNGYDPEETTRAVERRWLDPNRHSFVHTGRTGLAGVTLRPLLEAIGLLARKDPAAARRLEFVFAGPLSVEEQELLRAPGIAPLVYVTGPLGRADVLALQREADTLVVVTGGAARPSVATGKLFEYIAAERRILVLGEETEAARIVRETRTGTATSAGDPLQIAQALADVVAESPSVERDETAVARYSWSVLAEEYADVLEDACRRRD